MFTLRTTSKKSEAEPVPAKRANANRPDIAYAPVPRTLAALHDNPDTGLTRTEMSRAKLSGGWVSWFFGLGLLVAVVMFATHHNEEMAFAQLMLHARPAWLLGALLPQIGTYMTDARIWQRVLGRANISKPLRSYIGLGLAKLFMDQAIPSLGLSGCFWDSLCCLIRRKQISSRPSVV
jgi:hypothetical protein